MKRIISHFWYSRTQRNGILFLVCLIAFLQVALHTIHFDREVEFNTERVALIRAELDSLANRTLKSSMPRIYPFNPNFISDYKGYRLGISVDEMDRLMAFRESKRFINSAKEFQEVTHISDSLLQKISPYFKFPKWVLEKKKDRKKVHMKSASDKTFLLSTTDLNDATVTDLYSIASVDEFLAKRIVNYRVKLQGFYFTDQLNEVWQINSKQVQEILKVFQIKSKPHIQKLNINTASFKEVLSIPYIDYDLCKKIFQFRDEVAELQSISEMKRIEGFPLDKYDRIVLYLQAK